MSHPTNFRVWSKQSSKWMNNIVLSAQGTPILMYSEKVDDRVFHRVFLVDNYEPVVQMSTGMKDKNGVEIFEGDIIKVRSEGFADIEAIVGWNTDRAAYEYSNEPTEQYPVSIGQLLRAPISEIIDTVVEKSARAALESAATAAEKAAEPQIVT